MLEEDILRMINAIKKWTVEFLKHFKTLQRDILMSHWILLHPFVRLLFKCYLSHTELGKNVIKQAKFVHFDTSCLFALDKCAFSIHLRKKI